MIHLNCLYPVDQLLNQPVVARYLWPGQFRVSNCTRVFNSYKLIRMSRGSWMRDCDDEIVSQEQFPLLTSPSYFVLFLHQKTPSPHSTIGTSTPTNTHPINDMLVFDDIVSYKLASLFYMHSLAFKYNQQPMKMNYEKFSKLFPFQESLIAKRQREEVWAKWDTMNNGFLSLDEIQEGFLDMFNLEVSQEITTIIKQCADETKIRYDVNGKFGPNYMEKREFRGFLEYLHRHIKSLVLYEANAKNSEIEHNKLIEITMGLLNKSLSEEQESRAKMLSREAKISFNTFQKWLTSLNFYALGETKV